MFVVHGAYHWWPKRVGFRNDYCLRCKAERRAVCIRTFDVGHVFWIPCLPVGFWKHWKCSVCGYDPHKNPKTTRFAKWFCLCVLIGISALFWSEPATGPDTAIDWTFRIGGVAGALLLLVHLLRTPADPSLREKMERVLPATDSTCPFCRTPLLGGERWSCPGCGVVRY